MPYADREEQKRAQREYYERKYYGNAAFRKREKKRKAAWFQERGKIIQQTRRRVLAKMRAKTLPKKQRHS